MTTAAEKTVELENAIRFNDLLSGGTSFKINHENMAETIDLDIFDEAGSDDEENIDTNEDSDRKLSPWKKSFKDLRLLMTQVPNNFGTVFKRIVTDGVGNLMQSNNCRIQWTFSMFFETEEFAFDSKCKPVVTDKAEMLIGIQVAIESMRKKEEAQFIIDYRLMFGELGCPPRIKPKADVLLVVKLLNFEETGDERACEGVPEMDLRKFHILKDKINEMHKKSLDHIKNKRYRYAIDVSRSAIRSLELCQVANESEQSEQQKLLNELYLQMSSCYVKVEEWKKCCLMVNELRHRTNISRNVTVILNEAIALSHIDTDYKRSIKLLRTAQQIEPNNEQVNSTLNEILAKDEKYKKDQEQMWKKAYKKMGIL